MQSKIDSLITLLKTDKEDTNKIIHLNKIGVEFINNGSYDTALQYSNDALRRADVILNDKVNASKQVHETILKCKANAYNNIGNIYYGQGDYPKTLDYWLKALKIYEELKYKIGIARCLGNIGVIYLDQSDYSQAMYYFLKSLKMSEELGNKNITSHLFGYMGSVYAKKIEYQKSLDYYFKALDIPENLKDKNGIATYLGNIGGVYHLQKEYQKALEYYLKALNISQELQDKK